jgi:hypothetical protein
MPKVALAIVGGAGFAAGMPLCARVMPFKPLIPATNP